MAAAGTRFLEENPGHPEVLLMVGDAQLKLGRPGEAIGHFAAVHQTGRFTAEALQGQGLSLLALGQAGQASEPLERAIAADPSLWAGVERARHRQRTGARNGPRRRPPTARRRSSSRPSAAIANNLGISLIMQETLPGRRRGVEPRRSGSNRWSNEQARSNLRFAYALQGRYLEAMAGVTREGNCRTC